MRWLGLLLVLPVLAGSTVLACGGLDSGTTTPPVDGVAAVTDAATTSAATGPSCGATPTTLVSAYWMQPDAFQEQVGDIAVSGTTIFFALYAPGSLWSVPVAGGTPTKLASLDGEEAQMLALPGSVVVAESFDGTQGSEILEVPASGGSPTTLATADGSTWSLITDGTDVYFSDQSGTKVVSAAGGAVQTLTTQTGTLGLAGSALLIADFAGGNVFSIPKSGGTLTTIATNQSSPYFPVSNGTDVCWIDALSCAGVPDADVCVAGQGEGAIVCASPNGAPATIAESSSLYLPTRMLFDGGYFFVTTGKDASFDGPLARVPASGGTPTVIGQADGVAIADGCAFAIDFLNGIYTVSTSGGP